MDDDEYSKFVDAECGRLPERLGRPLKVLDKGVESFLAAREDKPNSPE
jgi:hypothetical protein